MPPRPGSKARSRRLFILLLPFVAVGLGLYLFQSAWLTILLYHAGIVAYLVLSRVADWRGTLSSGWRPLLGLVFCAACATSGLALVVLWPVIAASDLSSALGRLGLHGTSWWFFVAYYSTLHPILEEAFWRGSDLARESAHGLAELAFGAYHFFVLIFFVRFEWALVTTVVLVLTARTWRIVAKRTGGLAIPIVSHATADLSTMIAATYLAGSSLGGLGV